MQNIGFQFEYQHQHDPGQRINGGCVGFNDSRLCNTAMKLQSYSGEFFVKKAVNVKREERVYRVLEALEHSRAIQGQSGHPLPKPLILIWSGCWFCRQYSIEKDTGSHIKLFAPESFFAFLGGLLAKWSVMRMGKATIQITLITVVLFTGCGRALSGQTTVLNGSQLPQDQGWSVMTNAALPVDVVTHGRTLTFNTIGVLSKGTKRAGGAVVWFYKEVPFDFNEGFSIEFTLKVHKVEQSHNLYDAGIMFYGSTIDPSNNFSGDPRSQILFFDENAIGWGDETGMFEMDTTDIFHTYTLAVDDKGVAKVFVDGKLRLKRKKWEGIPRIGFGDMTNDLGINGRFSIGDIIVTAQPPNSHSRPAPRRRLIPPSRPGSRR